MEDLLAYLHFVVLPQVIDALIIRDGAHVIWGTETGSVAAPLTGITNFAEVFVPTYRIFVFSAGLLAIAVTWWLVYRTQIGAVLRATAVDPSMVASFGIPIRLVRSEEHTSEL